MSVGVVSSSRAATAFIGALLLTCRAVIAQGQEAARPPRTGKSWRVSPALSAESGYNDNVFLVESNKKDNIDSPSADDVTSGRYIGMESANDVVSTFVAAFEVRGPGVSGRTLALVPTVNYSWYARNSERNSAVLGLSLEQDLPKDGRLRIQGQLTPSFFLKNYLTDAVDSDGDGSISPAERVYARSEYRESELSLDYRFRLARSSSGHSFRALLQLGAGYYDRTFDAPFPGRDLHGLTAAARLLMRLSRAVSVDAGYAFSPQSATTTSEVVLLDEPDFGQDFNGNGNTTDPDVRVVSPVDRSRDEHNLGGGIQFGLGRRTNLELDYEHRWRLYSSTEPLDVSHNGREDARNRVGVLLDIRLAKGIRLHMGGEGAFQTTNRAGDPASTGEINDYTRYQAGIGLSFTF